MAEESIKPVRDLSPSAQRWRRFLDHRRGSWSLRILVSLYALSLVSEFICNDRPLFLRTSQGVFFPVFRSYTQDRVLGNGVQTRMTDYRSLRTDPEFVSTPGNKVVMPLIPYGPHENLRTEDLADYRTLSVTARPLSRVARLQIGADGRVVWAEGDLRHFFPGVAEGRIAGERPGDFWEFSPEFAEAVASRFAGGGALPAFEAAARSREIGELGATVRMAARGERGSPPDSVRVVMRDPREVAGGKLALRQNQLKGAFAEWEARSPGISRKLEKSAALAFGEYVPPLEVRWDDTAAEVFFEVDEVTWPFRPAAGHYMGIDMAGRDVLARLLYGLRTSLTFGLLLVISSLILGLAAGAIQGYFAGWVDLAGQRLTEIWSALPFLYVMILLGNSLGRSFLLLLLCYAAFNWIGIAAYARAEYLRLRRRAFVDSARSQGLGSARIMLRHILPNALTPLITLFPFELVGAVGSLAALDYLGFGLPDGTPSWGELLRQAQLVRNAWWLILYPSLALFTVMLLGIFIGEGLREAFDPKPYSKLE